MPFVFDHTATGGPLGHAAAGLVQSIGPVMDIRDRIEQKRRQKAANEAAIKVGQETLRTGDITEQSGIPPAAGVQDQSVWESLQEAGDPNLTFKAIELMRENYETTRRIANVEQMIAAAAEEGLLPDDGSVDLLRKTAQWHPDAVAKEIMALRVHANQEQIRYQRSVDAAERIRSAYAASSDDLVRAHADAISQALMAGVDEDEAIEHMMRIQRLAKHPMGRQLLEGGIDVDDVEKILASYYSNELNTYGALPQMPQTGAPQQQTPDTQRPDSLQPTLDPAQPQATAPGQAFGQAPTTQAPPMRLGKETLEQQASKNKAYTPPNSYIPADDVDFQILAPDDRAMKKAKNYGDRLNAATSDGQTPSEYWSRVKQALYGSRTRDELRNTLVTLNAGQFGLEDANRRTKELLEILDTHMAELKKDGTQPLPPLAQPQSIFPGSPKATMLGTSNAEWQRQRQKYDILSRSGDKPSPTTIEYVPDVEANIRFFMPDEKAVDKAESYNNRLMRSMPPGLRSADYWNEVKTAFEGSSSYEELVTAVNKINSYYFGPEEAKERTNDLLEILNNHVAEMQKYGSGR